MKNLFIVIGLVLAWTSSSNVFAFDVNDIEVMEGEKKLACQMLLCLMASTREGRPDECSDPIKEYFNIKHKKPWKTFNMRLDFLKLCPEGDSSGRLHEAVAGGAGFCETDVLTARLNIEEGVAGLGADAAAAGFGGVSTKHGKNGAAQIPSVCVNYAQVLNEYDAEIVLPVKTKKCTVEAKPSWCPTTQSTNPAAAGLTPEQAAILAGMGGGGRGSSQQSAQCNPIPKCTVLWVNPDVEKWARTNPIQTTVIPRPTGYPQL